MAIEFKLPDLGENINDGEVVNVRVAAGDQVEADQPVLDLETGKATIEVPAPAAGRIAEVLVGPGDHVKVGQPILLFEGAENPAEAPAKESPPESTPPPPPPAAEQAPATEPVAAPEPEVDAPSSGPVEFSLPELGENIEDGEVVRISVHEGQSIQVDQTILELETGKATLEIPSGVAGIVETIWVKEGEKIAVGQRLITVDPKGTPHHEPPPTRSGPPPSAAPPLHLAATPKAAPEGYFAPPVPLMPPDTDHVPVRAAPSVRKFAREIGLSIRSIPPSEPGGRITIEDVKAFARTRLAGGDSAAPAPAPSKPLPDFSKWGTIERERMSGLRKAAAEHLSLAWRLIPHVTQHDTADITDIEKLRKQYNEQAAEKLTLTILLLKVLASALKDYPKFNASIDIEQKEVILKRYIHIGLAVDTPGGLMVPVVRDVDQKSLSDLSVEAAQLAAKARDGKLSPSEMQGGTFTISNLGGIGGGFFTPIVNTPEVAILGVGRGARQAVFQDDRLVSRLVLPLSLSYDHRLIDGADGARFLRRIVELLENPAALSIEPTG